MDMNRYFKSYKSTAEQLINQAANYTEAEFSLAPAEGQWSMSEIEENGKRQKFAFGPALFSLMGSFPPIKLRIKKNCRQASIKWNNTKQLLKILINTLEWSIGQVVGLLLPNGTKVQKCISATT
eukprot:gene38386-51852_t